MTTTSAVDRFLAGLADPSTQTDDVYTPDTVLDATVPEWRFRKLGATAFAAQIKYWFVEPAVFKELYRAPLPDGELVEFTLAWTAKGMVHEVHQVHLIRVDGGRIAHDLMFCGGQWPEPLLARMAAADA